MLFDSHPSNANTWTARSKDHDYQSPATITAYAIGIYDPHDRFTTKVFSRTSELAQHPEVTVSVERGWKMVGGGAEMHWTEHGSLLTASYPSSTYSWTAKGKDHVYAEMSTVTAYAIAIYDPRDEFTVKTFQRTSAVASHPEITVAVDPGWEMLCGGAFVDDHTGHGNLLTASYASSETAWTARSKDHQEVDLAAITAYAIGIRFAASGQLGARNDTAATIARSSAVV